MSYRGRYSSKYSSSSYRPRRSYLAGKGAYRVRKPIRYRPKPRYIKGRGAYYVQAGGYLKGHVGPIKGGATVAGGYSNHMAMPTMTGLGAYNISNIKHNVLIKPDLPQVKNAIYAEGGTIIRHKEYLGAVTTSATAGQFKIETYPLNPAQARTFSWLSTIAQNYEEYKPNGLVFEFRSTASDAIASSTNLALGQVMLCTQYDPTDPNFASDVELLNYTWAQSGKVSDNLLHYVECDPKQSPLSHLYTRAGSYVSDSDLRFSDFGTFSIATSGLQGTSVQIGQLWVSYEFIMYKPKIGGLSATNGGWFHAGEASGSVSNINPFGANPMATAVFDAENNLGVTLSDVGNYGRITFPLVNIPTSFQVDIIWRGDSTASVTTPSIVASDAAVHYIQHFDDNQTAYCYLPSASSTSNTALIKTWVSIPADGSQHYFDVTNSTLPANCAVDVYVSQIPYLDPDLYG